MVITNAGRKDSDGDRDRPERATGHVADERREDDQRRGDDAREGEAVQELLVGQPLVVSHCIALDKRDRRVSASEREGACLQAGGQQIRGLSVRLRDGEPFGRVLHPPSANRPLAIASPTLARKSLRARPRRVARARLL